MNELSSTKVFIYENLKMVFTYMNNSFFWNGLCIYWKHDEKYFTDRQIPTYEKLNVFILKIANKNQNMFKMFNAGELYNFFLKKKSSKIMKGKFF